jgi:hypothetical protein
MMLPWAAYRATLTGGTVTTLAAPPMPKSDPTPYCTYANIRIDDQVLPLARAAAALSGDVTIQEFISDAVNAAAAKVLNRKPIQRRTPPPKPHGKGRPKRPG